MKKGLFLALVLIFAVASVAFAKSGGGTVVTKDPGNVGSTSEQGSVLIFPKIDITTGDTIISISNSNTVPVNVECVWIPAGLPETIPYIDLQFSVTPSQPFAFDALGLYGGLTAFGPTEWQVCKNAYCCKDVYSYVGELKCWATDANYANQINFNYLSGSAKVIDFECYTAYEYNAWTFAALAGTTGADVGTAGTIALDGVNFQACPYYFLGNFFAAGSGYGFIKDTDLTLVPCKQYVNEEKVAVTTKAKFTIYGDNENGYSGAIQCVTNWFEGWLSCITNGNLSSVCSLHGAAARFRVQGVASQDCAGSIASPLVGLLVEDLCFFNPEMTDSKSINVLTASTGFGAGIDPSGFIVWDPEGPPVSAKKK